MAQMVPDEMKTNQEVLREMKDLSYLERFRGGLYGMRGDEPMESRKCKLKIIFLLIIAINILTSCACNSGTCETDKNFGNVEPELERKSVLEDENDRYSTVIEIYPQYPGGIQILPKKEYYVSSYEVLDGENGYTIIVTVGKSN